MQRLEDSCAVQPIYGSLGAKVLLFTTLIIYFFYSRHRWFPVTRAWRVLRLRMEERTPILWAAANILNNQLRTADKRCYPTLGVRRGTKNSSPSKCILLRNIHKKPWTWTDNLIRPKQRKWLTASSCLRKGTGGGHL
jgi:hypothetical protein